MASADPRPRRFRLLAPIMAAVTVAALAYGYWTAYQQTENSHLANLSSIWGAWLGVAGFLLSAAGFALTIDTMLQTQHIAREAQEEIQAAASRSERAVEEAQRQTRASMDRVATTLLWAEVEQLLRHLLSAHGSGDAGHWQAALFSYQQAHLLIPYLAGSVRLDAEGKDAIQRAADAIPKVVSYVQKKVAKDDRGQGLGGPHAFAIQEAIQGVSSIVVRLRNQSMEVPRAT